MNSKTEITNKSWLGTIKPTLESDLLTYIKATLAYAVFFFVWLGVARTIDLNSDGKTEIIKEVLALVAPQTLKLLIGMYAITAGLWAMLGGRFNQMPVGVKFSKGSALSFIYNRLLTTLFFFTNILSVAAKFSKDTTFIFLGLLIAATTISSIVDYRAVTLLLGSIIIALVFFFIYGFIDYVAKQSLKEMSAGYVLSGMFLISLGLPVLLA